MTRVERACAWGVGIAFWAAFALPVLVSGDRLGIWDWDHHFAFYAVERMALVEHGTLPLWAPYLSGGTVSLQHPLSSFLWPDFLWIALFGVPWGVKLLLAFRFAVGLAGAWVLSRSYGLRTPAALLSAVVMTGSGAWSAHVAFGHFEWTLFAYAPWALFAVRRSIERRSLAWAGVAAAGIAALYLGGGIYLLVGFALLLGLLSLFEAVYTRSWRALALPLLALALSAPLSAAKLVPSASYFSERPRTTSQRNLLLQREPQRGWLEVPRALHFVFLERGFAYPLEFAARPSHVGRGSTRQEALQRWQLFQDINYNAHVGVLVLLLVAAGLILPGVHRGVLGCTLALMLLLVLSDSLQRAFGFHPWWALKRLPALGSLGVAGRFAIFAVVPLALLAGLGLQQLLDRFAPRRYAPLLAGMAIAVVGVDLGWNGATRLSASFPHPPPVEAERVGFRTFEEPRLGSDLATVRARLGARLAHSNLVAERERPVLHSAAPGYRGEVWLRGGGTAELVEIRPNLAHVLVREPAADELVLNQMYVPGWRRTDRDAAVFPAAGLVATEVSSEDSEVRLEFRPPGLWLGLAISALSVLALLAVVVRARR